MQKLILWDVDGTLIYSGGVAGESMRAAMTRVYGRASTEARHSYAGKTDRQIILETFAERGHDGPRIGQRHGVRGRARVQSGHRRMSFRHGQVF